MNTIPGPSPLILQLNFRWTTNPNLPIRFPIIPKHNKRDYAYHCKHIKVLQEGTGVLSPYDTVSLFTDTGEGEIQGLVNGVEEKTDSFSKASTKRFLEKKVDDDEDSDDTRFKLRNGKEVLHTKVIKRIHLALMSHSRNLPS